MQTTLIAPRHADPKPRRWTKAEYYRMAELGWFRGERVELIDGEIVALGPQKFEHGQVADRIAELLRAAFGGAFWVRMQLPLDLDSLSEPEPDVSVVQGHREDYHEHPKNAVLVVEVSDTALLYDRGDKASLYACAGIADYWVVDLSHRELHVYRDPVPDPGQRHGFRYRSVATLRPGDAVAPLGAPSGHLTIVDLLR